MIWNIAVDSSCDLRELEYQDENNEVRFHSVPFTISVGKHDYIDDGSIVTEQMLTDMEGCKEASRTACPAPGAWLDSFGQEGNVIAVTISAELSGSYGSAITARDLLLEQEPGRNVAVINSVSTGPGMMLILQAILQGIRENRSFAEVAAQAEAVNAAKGTMFALCSFNNLVKNGRMSPFMGFLAQKLNMWGIGVATEIGQIDVKSKVRGPKKALSTIVRNLHSSGHTIGKVIIHHCKNADMAQQLKALIFEASPQTQVEINETQGLCSFYAERSGLIIAYL